MSHLNLTVKAGWVQKKGGFKRFLWQDRYMIVHGDTLKWKEGDLATLPFNNITVLNYDIIVRAHPEFDTATEFFFSVERHLLQHLWQFKVGSAEERRSWIRALSLGGARVDDPDLAASKEEIDAHHDKIKLRLLEIDESTKDPLANIARSGRRKKSLVYTRVGNSVEGLGKYGAEDPLKLAAREVEVLNGLHNGVGPGSRNRSRVNSDVIYSEVAHLQNLSIREKSASRTASSRSSAVISDKSRLRRSQGSFKVDSSEHLQY